MLLSAKFDPTLSFHYACDLIIEDRLEHRPRRYSHFCEAKVCSSPFCFAQGLFITRLCKKFGTRSYFVYTQ